MSDIIEAAQKQDPGAELITLFTLELDSGFAYFHSGGFTNSAATTNVFFRDAASPYTVREYEVLPMEADGFDISADGSYSRPIATIANVASVFSSAIGDIDYEELIGNKLTRRTTLKQFLDNGSGNSSSPPIEYPKMVYVIDRIKDRNIISVTFELANPYDLAGVTLPRRQIIAGSCPWKYQGASPHLSESAKVGGCNWDKFSRNNVGAGEFTLYMNKEDEYVVPSSITFTTFSSSATAGSYYKTAVTKTKINNNGTQEDESIFDYWQCMVNSSTSPTDGDSDYRRVRIFQAYSASTEYKAYTDTGYNEYVTYGSPAQLWQVKTLGQTASAHNSTPTQNKYWTIGDRCSKSINACMRRFQALNDGNGGAHITTTFQNKALPFGGFPASKQHR